MSAPVPAYVFNGTATRIIDGDTLEIRLDLGRFAGCKVEATPKIRLNGYSAPELRDPGGVEAAEYLAALVVGKPLIVRTYKASFERTVADVWLGSVLVGDLMTQAGHV